MSKLNSAYKSIGEVAEILSLKDKKTGKLNTHTIRFWEKNFKQIKPKFFSSNRRYYDHKTIELLIKIQYLLKDEGMKISGVKKLLSKDQLLKLDDLNNKTINNRENNLVIKLNKIAKIVKEIKEI
tara:strand:+ start:59 stop:433 length:375 start_codon:yes stop_codon:yes gene_type:complete